MKEKKSIFIKTCVLIFLFFNSCLQPKKETVTEKSPAEEQKDCEEGSFCYLEKQNDFCKTKYGSSYTYDKYDKEMVCSPDKLRA